MNRSKPDRHLAEMADDAVAAHLAATVVTRALRNEWGLTWTRESALQEIARPFMPSDATERALARALAVGLVQEDANGRLRVVE